MKNFEKLMSIHNQAIDTKNIDGMKAADSVFRKALKRLSEIDDSELESLVEIYDGSLNWHNYISEDEAMYAAEKLVNNRGEHGAKWSPDNFFRAAKDLNIKDSEEPFYNKWSLWLTANMIVSDCEEVLLKWCGSDQRKFVQMTCDFAVSKLKDVDRPKFVRWYFGL